MTPATNTASSGSTYLTSTEWFCGWSTMSSMVDDLRRGVSASSGNHLGQQAGPQRAHEVQNVSERPEQKEQGTDAFCRFQPPLLDQLRQKQHEPAGERDGAGDARKLGAQLGGRLCAGEKRKADKVHLDK
ncbi:hypothetical protein KL943_004726 [Ogataea angusta]|nr:hypothetical protein KL943_004726 [Ogataea angusta]